LAPTAERAEITTAFTIGLTKESITAEPAGRFPYVPGTV
jgi:hypothetical protein